MPFFRATTDFNYGIFNATQGALIDTTEELGCDLIGRGYAERVETQAALREFTGTEPEPEPEIEQATNEPERETATQRAKRKPRNVGPTDDDPDTGALFE